MASDLRSLPDNELVAQLSNARRSLVAAKFALASGRLEDTSKLGRFRKQIARISTEMRRRELAGQLPAGTLASRAGLGEAQAQREQASGGFLSGLVDKLD